MGRFEAWLGDRDFVYGAGLSVGDGAAWYERVQGIRDDNRAAA